MTLTSFDMQAFLNQLAEQPQARNQLRGLLLNDALQTWPERMEQLTGSVNRLAEAQLQAETRLTRLETAVKRLAEAQLQTETRLTRLEAGVQALAEAQQRTEARLEELAAAQQRTEARLEELAAAQQRTEARLEQLAAAQRHTETQVAELAAALRQAEQRLTRLEEAVQALLEAQRRTEIQMQRFHETMDSFQTWQRGEAGRRDGERYERLIARRALSLFLGGDGDSPLEYAVRQRLAELLHRLPDLGVLSDEDNPLLADLVWWKGDQVAVVEVTQQVNSNDVVRAGRRSETLRRAGVAAFGAVIGEDWMAEDTRQLAKTRAVEWKVGDDLSAGFLDFRQLPALSQNE
jgi:K+/H+ antiporter YhaU regulatory subunit KhtT